MHLFPFAEYWWVYLTFTGFVMALLILDLGVFHRKSHEVSIKEATFWTITWISIAGIFNIGLYFYAQHAFAMSERLQAIPGFNAAASAKEVAIAFLAGYVMEKSLAIDNIFVFSILFSYFAVPKIYQHRILFYGIIGALAFRALFISLGSYIMEYHAVVVLFGVFLIFTGLKMLMTHDKVMEPERSFLLRILGKLFRIHPKIESAAFFIKKDGLLYATPLFLTLVFVELSDILFAIDSVPAIFALTKEPLIVFTSNILAILGLRSLYFLILGVLDRFRYIQYGLAAVLVFVGAKMVGLNNLIDGGLPITWSLAVILTCIGTSIVASLVIPVSEKTTNDTQE